MSKQQGAVSKSQTVTAGSSGSKLSLFAIMLVIGGAVLCALALASEEGKQRFGFAYLWGFTLVWSVVLGSFFFVILHHLSGAVWSVVLRRVAEMFASSMWLIALCFIPIVIFCYWHDIPLFHWIHHEPSQHDPTIMGHFDPVIDSKRGYLNDHFFVLRGIVFFVLWFLLTRYFVGKSLQQDIEQATVSVTAKLRRISAPVMILFAFTTSFAAFDWLMSLDPHWFSTIYGVYIFSGMVLIALSVITISVIWLRYLGRLGDGIVTGEHLYSLGVLLFVFTCFWAYIWFSQFMLIWYGNIPEETIWFSHRGWGPDGNPNWLWMTWALMIIRFVVPFVLLLSRQSKTNPRTLVVSSVIIIFGQLLDLYWLIMPQSIVGEEKPILGWQEVGPICLLAGLVMFSVSRFMAKHRCVAVGDPLFERSCHFHL